MAKRFISTDMFEDEWFMDLSKDAKLLYIYLFTNCDHAGIIKLNTRLVKFQIGIKDLGNTLKELGNRSIQFDKKLENVYFLPKYIRFQYPDFPKSKVKQQESALKILQDYNIDFNSYLTVSDSHEHEHEHDTVNDNVIVNVNDNGNGNINVFDFFWNLYDKKVDRPKSERKWNALSDKDQQAIIDYIPKYIKSQPDKKFRKNPTTFLNNRSWENEIIDEGKSNEKGTASTPEHLTGLATEREIKNRTGQ